MTSVPIRVGVVRSSSPDPVVALAEARVVRHELTRRLGEVALDFRTTGAASTPWIDRAHAAWPSDVDAVLDLDTIPRESGALTALFARTLDPDAVDVRRRMLRHLGILPAPVVDDAWLDEHLPTPRRPTDVWIAVHDAASVDLADAAVLAFGDDGSTAIDEWFDQFVGGLDADPSPTIERLSTRVAELERELAVVASEAARSERSALQRIDELIDECGALRERLRRTELDAGTATGSTGAG